MQGRLKSGNSVTVRRRFWHRRGHLVITYACVALFCGGLALTASYAGMVVIAHLVQHHR